MEQIIVRDLGRMEYKAAWDIQDGIFQAMVGRKLAGRGVGAGREGRPSHHLLFCEHDPVVTIGKSGNEQNLLASAELLRNMGIGFYRNNRGGDITYHGPGQVVGYPILDLDCFFTDIHRYLRFLEEVIILAMADYGLKGDRLPGSTGVWMDPGDLVRARKICAIGVRTSRWVTMHGFAFNVNTDLRHFDLIVPCGITGKQVTSMQRELGREIDTDEVKSAIVSHFGKVFGAAMTAAPKGRTMPAHPHGA